MSKGVQAISALLIHFSLVITEYLAVIDVLYDGIT